MANATGIRTRAGIIPSDKALPYSVTTSEVEEYLQKRVDAVVKASNGKVDRVEVKIYSTDSGSKFMPFVVILPTSVLVNNKKDDNDDDVEYIFNPKNEDKNVIINQAYYKLFRSYTYDKNDEKAFFSDDWRRRTGVSNSTSYILKKLRTPKVTNLSGTKVILFMIDPLRVFHDMVVSMDDKRDFKITVTDLKRMEKGKARYDFKREIVNSGKTKYAKDVIDELNYRMRGNK